MENYHAQTCQMIHSIGRSQEEIKNYGEGRKKEIKDY